MKEEMDLVAKTFQGLEDVLAEELKQLGATDVKPGSTTDDYQNLIRVMQRRGLRREEPLDDTLITASPALLKTSVIMLLQENVFTPAEFMEELSNSYGLSINATEVERLLALPAGTLAVQKIIRLPNLQLKRNAT